MRSFLRTLVKPDYDDNPEKSEIAQAANILQIGEFQLIQLAYQQWFGEEVQEKDLDRMFSSYMLYHEVTPWMRHYAREIIDGYESGGVDIDDPDFHRYDHVYITKVRNGHRRFLGACVFLAAMLIGSLWLSGLRTEDGGGSRFPPYFTAEELKQSDTGVSIR